jgi:hypothetical protein
MAEKEKNVTFVGRLEFFKAILNALELFDRDSGF